MSRAPAPMKGVAASLATIGQWLNPNWVMEEKFDGDRGMAVIEATGTRFIDAKGGNRSASFPDVAQVRGAKTLLTGTILDFEFQAPALEGEAYASFGKTNGWFNSGPTPSRMLRAFYKRAPHIRVFDILAENGQSTMGKTYDERRAILEKIVPLILEAYPDCGIELVPQYPATMENLAAILARGGEGVMLKYRAGRYMAGKRSDFWRKVKAVATIDVALTGNWKPGKGGRVNTVGAVEVAVFEDDGTMRTLGYVAVKPNMATAYTDPITHGLRPELAWTVWEVEANGLYEGSLRFPRHKRTRDDKTATAHQCGTGQLDALPLAA